MKKTIFVLLVFGIILSVSIISALSIDFYYSESCPYCQEIKPLMNEIEKYYIVNWFETSEYQDEFRINGFTGVPAFIINTDDGREVKFTGANLNKLNCELNEMSTKECVTYSANNCIGESWFIE